jgi:hypothetical protein
MFDARIKIKGATAQRIKNLNRVLQPKRGTSPFRIFPTYIDILVCGALVGFKHRMRDEVVIEDDETADESFVEILADVVIKESKNLEHLFRMIMLNEDDRNLPLEERINNAFRYDGNEEKTKENLNLFYSYVHGGIKVLDDWFIGVVTQEDAIEVYKEILGIDDRKKLLD